ncbi:actin-like protein-like protein 6A [Pseudovirgaria hyperparasitica]|uniref:Actin-like protein-like protein 6A n=1 Tax=Pseudovirgaria hyperparasitica TaxID=470096 RepID=A0A6A6WAL6_9PEZI|nr:actin-like protein-like protein 6A [Pseudovirgaria hyperparasitica]KAF2758161.1 actin-like protein-like protein 6A [Pseudovirgaria hyperparasitica]
MAVPNANTAPLSEYAGDEVSALVLDPGWSTTRAGFAGEDAPKSVIPTHYGVSSSDSRLFFGENAIHSPQANLQIKNPWSADGIVEDWDTAAKLWEYSITSRLTGPKPTHPEKNGLNDDPNGEAMELDAQEEVEKPLTENPLLMTEPGWNPVKAREKYIEIAMEDWGVPAYWLGRSGVLAAFAAGKASALVVDVGANITSVTPVVDGIMMKKGVQKSPLAGNFVSNQIRAMFKQNQVPLTPHYMVSSKTAVDAGAPSQATYKKFETAPPASYRRLQEERVLTEFKESVVQCWTGPGKLSNGTNEEIAKSQPPRPFEMPDGWNQVFGLDRFKVTEGLFDETAALEDDENAKPTKAQTIPAMIQAALNQVDVDQRPHLLNNVVVTGASSFLPGFNDRLNAELQGMYPSPRIRLSAPGNTIERKYASWIGGSILGSLGSFHQMWISKKEYDEHGANIVEKRCK